jgi:hypothetical protein
MIKNVKFFPTQTSTNLKIGDLVSVQYRDSGAYEVGWHEEIHLGFVTMVPPATPENPAGMIQMWCINTNSHHIITPRLDKVEIVSEA